MTSIVLGLIALAIVVLATHTACSGVASPAAKVANAWSFRDRVASFDCTVLGDDCVMGSGRAGELDDGDACLGVASNLIDRCHEFDRAATTWRDDGVDPIEDGERSASPRGDELGRPAWLGRIDVGVAWRRTTTFGIESDRVDARSATVIDEPVDELWLLATWSR